MQGLPARCLNPRCGFVFDASGLFGGTNSRIRLVDVQTNCPKCGASADMGAGSYSLQNDRLTLIDGPSLTRQMLNQLSVIANAAKSGISDTEHLLTEVAGVSPELAEKLKRHGLPYFVIILLLFWLCKSVTINVDVDLNKLIDQARGIASDSTDPSVLDAPSPLEDLKRSPGQQSEWAAQQSGPMSRQVRRQLERRAKKGESEA